MPKVRQAPETVPSRRAFLGGAAVATGAIMLGFTLGGPRQARAAGGPAST